jgi:hypothetical protein
MTESLLQVALNIFWLTFLFRDEVKQNVTRLGFIHSVCLSIIIIIIIIIQFNSYLRANLTAQRPITK